MAEDYKTLVLHLLSKRQYPILKDIVVMDIHYKLLPENADFDVVHAYDKRSHDAMYTLSQHADPFRFSYLVGNENMFYVHETDHFDTTSLPLHCQRVKLNRYYVDVIQNQTSETFEEELYHFITLLNFDIPTLSPLLGLDTITCTRMLPKFIKLWVFKYDAQNFQKCPVSKGLETCFGPPETTGVIPVRVLRGKLSPCTSHAKILSLNNDFPTKLKHPYLMHYSPLHKTLFPLVYNPLENPLLVF